MSAIDRLLTNYSRQVRLPWSASRSGKQRVWFAVYPPADERRVRARLPQFEATTLEAQHEWLTVDLTSLLPQWMAEYEYREAAFKEPDQFTMGSQIEDLAVDRVRHACNSEDATATCVVAVTGLATLFDYMRVSSLVERVEDSVRGRLLVFFPGEYAGNVYRFMDARDGFNYLAVPLTATESFLQP